MSDGLAKSAPVPEAEVAPVENKTTSAIPLIDNVPIDVFRYFNVDPFTFMRNEKEQIKTIFRILGNKHEDMGDLMLELRAIERRLGAPIGNESRYSKIYNYLQLQHQRDQVNKKMESLEHG